jgi:hypothetical protein
LVHTRLDVTRVASTYPTSFFDRDWRSLGTKFDLIDDISTITKVDLYALMGGDLSRLSVARRMSWVANRQTTRLEDMAYCLLGIFGINMPLLYGEGMKAFIRLQEEILKITDDQSIFAWRDPTAKPYRDDYPEECNPQSLLAPSPDLFQYSKSISQFYVETPGPTTSTFTNKGLKVNFLVCQDSNYPSELVYMAILNCAIGRLPGHLPGIRLRRLASTSVQYARVDISLLFEFTNQGVSDASSGSNSQILADTQLRGFDPTKPQASLIEVETSEFMMLSMMIVFSGHQLIFCASERIVNDWIFMSIFVKQEPQFPPLPAFWLVMPERVSPQTQHPSKKRFGLLESFKYSNDVRQAYPPQFYDPETRTMQSQRYLGQGSKKLGALLVNYKGVDCILILGITYWESTPWCEVIESDQELGHYSFYPRDEDFWDQDSWFIIRDEDFRKRDFWYERQKRGYYEQLNRQAQPQTTILRHAFHNFNVQDVIPPTDTGTKRHRSVCKSLNLVSIVEHTTVSGREIYLLRLLFLSEEE